MPKFSNPFHKINWHTSTKDKKHHLGTVHSSQRSFNFSCWRLVISFKPNSLLISIDTSQTAFLYWWTALPETFVHFLMFNDTLKSFPSTFFCFYSVTHYFPIFRCFKVCMCCLLLQCNVWLAAKSKVCFALRSYHSINFVELSNSLLGLVCFTFASFDWLFELFIWMTTIHSISWSIWAFFLVCLSVVWICSKFESLTISLIFLQRELIFKTNCSVTT